MPRFILSESLGKSLVCLLQFLAVLCCGEIASAQSPGKGYAGGTNYIVRHYGIIDGLSNEWISDIAQDSAGFLWVATQYGLNRFDGADFDVFTYRADRESGPDANWTKKLFVSGPEEIWLGSFGRGLAVMNTRQEKFRSARDNYGWPALDVVEEIMEDGRGGRWVAASGDLCVEKTRGDQPVVIPGDRVRCLTTMDDGTVIGGGPEGLWIFNAEDTLRVQILDVSVEAVHGIGRDSLLYISSGLLRLAVRVDSAWENGSFSRVLHNRSSIFFLPAFTVGPDGRRWLTTGERVWSFTPDLGDWAELSPQEVLHNISGDVSIHKVFFDREGSMWWGTNRGLFQLKTARPFGRPLQKFGKEAPKSIREIVVRGDSVWLAAFDGIYFWRARGSLPPKRVLSGSFNALHLGEGGVLYTSGKYGGAEKILRLSSKTGQLDAAFSPEGEVEVNRCWRIIEDGAGRLWVASYNHLTCYDPETNRQFRIDLKRDGQTLRLGIIELLIDREDRLWLGTMLQGALRIDRISAFREGDEPEFRQFRPEPGRPASLSSPLVQQMHQTDRGEIWLATDGGLNQFLPETQTFRRFLRGKDLIDDKLMGITSDEEGHLWMSSISHGIIHFDPATEVFTSYGTGEGLPGNAMLMSSVFRDAKGGIWFGGQEGLTYFQPGQIARRQEVEAPSLNWVSYTLFGRDSVATVRNPLAGKSVQAPLVIGPRMHSIRWKFRALSFLAPEKIRYSFKLEGLHDDWLPATPNGEATLSNLPPGVYTLRAVATSTNPYWTARYAPIHLRILPVWYRSNLAYLAYLLLLGTVLYAFYRIQLRRRLAEGRSRQLEQLASEKMGWFNRVAHEFRTPLTVITGAVDRARSQVPGEEGKAHSDQAVNKQLSLIDGQARYLSDQVGQILELAKLRQGAAAGRPILGDFVAFHRYLLASFQLLAEDGGVRLNFTAPDRPLSFPFEEDAWRKITGNLLSNAIKFTPPGGMITIDISTGQVDGEHDSVILTVADTGIGMADGFQQSLFQPFTREHDLVPGTGLGLALTKELVTRASGRISVSSQPGEGSVFTVVLPLLSSQKSPGPIDPAPATAPTPNHAGQTGSLAMEADQRPLILIADDHPEILEYLIFCLARDYRLLTARDGARALTICQKEVPDLVLSDVMMPGLTGPELTRKLAEDLATDHIPVVLLTAKTSEVARVEGIESGAEAYLSKPFVRPELLAVIRGIIEKRSALKRKYGAGNFSVETGSRAADTFVRKVVAVITDNLANDEFTVQELAGLLFVSRTQLFRKIKSLTGKTPTLFIRQIRLARARAVLLANDGPISEVAYYHGFRDPAYFSRAYREEFSESPSETRENAGFGT